MQMLRYFMFALLLSFVSFNIQAQLMIGKDASTKVSGAEMVRYPTPIENPDYIKLKPGSEVPLSKFLSWMETTFRTNDEHSYRLISKESDDLGNVHFRYQQCWKGTPVRDAIFILHTRDNAIYSFNGKVYSEIQCSNQVALAEDAALQNALSRPGPVTYMWQLPQEEAFLKQTTGDPNATYFPKGEKFIIYDKNKHSFIYTWMFDVYASKPLSRQQIFVNAETGTIELRLDRIYTTDVPATVVTKYSGTKTMTTDSTAPGNYRLRETGRGDGINTYDLNQGTNYGSAVDFTDADNYWNNVNADQDEVAGDAHWGSEVTYDYFYDVHGRNSIDNNGFALISYVHYDMNYANAFWDGQRMTYGDGDGSTYSAFTALDICAHEITHGLTTFTANLDYVDESGALSEGFSDIFGTCAEFYGKPSLANWTCGEDIGTVLRSLSNPNATGNPDTYLGTNWDPGQEVHQNSTVCSHWFYRLSQGGSGTNDNGDAFSVTGQGITKAGRIAFRTLTVYLTNTSGYADAQFYSIIAASDLYGGCSPEVEATTDAWYAVGVGNAYVPTVVPEFDADFTSLCSAPVTIQFNNATVNGVTYNWSFGDGGTSTLTHPTHTYTALGDYTVKLVAYGGACGTDSITKTNYISLNTGNSAIVSMPATGTGMAQNCCSGTLYDSGGENDYGNNTMSTITIAPAGAMNVVLNFASFSMESGYDYLYVYDGPTTGSTLIGQYDGNTLPNGGTITSSGGSITLRQVTDAGVVASGFEISWQCNYPNAAPITNFTANSTETCTGVVQFTDQSSNGPISWFWDFGDGLTSTQQHPLHAYSANGTYSVKLRTANGFGSDSLTKTNYVVVDMPASPTVTPATICDSSFAILTASGSGQLDWFGVPVGGTVLYSGTSFTTPVLYTTTTYYVEDNLAGPSEYGGKVDNSGSGGFFGSSGNVHYEMFDCYTPLTLVSVKVYADGAGDRTILLRDASLNILDQLTVNVPDGESRVTLNFELPVANGLQLVGDGVPNLYRNNNGSATYPYTIPGKLSITESSASLPPYNVMGNYYYFYDWEIKGPTCISARVPVVATVIECNGIDEGSGLPGFSIGPNPCDDHLDLSYTSSSKGSCVIKLYDITGRIVFSASEEMGVGAFTYRLDMKALQAGTYTLSFSVDDQKSIQKIIKL